MPENNHLTDYVQSTENYLQHIEHTTLFRVKQING